MALKKYRKLALYLSSIFLVLVVVSYVSSRVEKKLGIPEVQQKESLQSRIDESIRSTPVAEHKAASQSAYGVQYEEDLPVTRTISYQAAPGWKTYVSPVGYSLQYMPWLKRGVHTEFRDDSECITIVSGINALMYFKVVPYNGEPARKLVFGDDSLAWTSIIYEKIQISGVNAIAIYVGNEEAPESGVGMYVVVPKENTALIVAYPYRNRVTEWEILLRTIKLQPSMDISMCKPQRQM